MSKKWKLQSVPSINGGVVTTHGEFSSVRDCTIGARAIKRALPNRTMFFSATECGASFGERHNILLSPGKYDHDVEIVLSDGQVVWLGDVDELLRKHLGTPNKEPHSVMPTGDGRSGY